MLSPLTLAPLALLLPSPQEALLSAPDGLSVAASRDLREAWLETATRGRLHLERGRGRLVDPSAPGQLVELAGSTEVPARGHLELGGASLATLTWPGACSARLTGSSSAEWHREPARTRLRIHDLTTVDIECRRGDCLVELPGGWRATLVEASMAARQLPDGSLELRVHAGSPVRVEWAGDRQAVRPPVWLHAGAAHRFEAIPDARPELPGARPWKSAEWPWAASAESPDERRERMALERLRRRFEELGTTWPGPGGPQLPARLLAKMEAPAWRIPGDHPPMVAWPEVENSVPGPWPRDLSVSAPHVNAEPQLPWSLVEPSREPGREQPLAPWPVLPQPVSPGSGE